MRRTIIFAIGSAVILIMLITGGYLLWSKVITKNNVSNDEKLVEKISRLIVLPEEVPTIATVTDKDKLAGQKFFVNAQNGDKVLIYTNAAKAILYRPDINKIVEVTVVLPVDPNKDKTMIVEPTITVEETDSL